MILTSADMSSVWPIGALRVLAPTNRRGEEAGRGRVCLQTETKKGFLKLERSHVTKEAVR